MLALAALGLSLVFGTTGLTNFAHGELITFGAVTTFLFQDQWGWAFIPAAILGVVLSGAFGYANDVFLWKPLRGPRHRTHRDDDRQHRSRDLPAERLPVHLRSRQPQLPRRADPAPPWEIGPIDVSARTFWSAVICVIVLIAISIAVQRTRLGKATRAVSDNPALAASSGIDVDRVILTIWIVGASLAGLSGILWGMNYGFDYQVGFKILLLVFAGVTLGGLGTIWGTMAGSLLVGVMVEMSSLVLPPELKYVTALVVLILVLLVRPQGILGRAQRVG